MEQVNYNIRDPEMEALIRMLGERISSLLPEGWGFNLLLFEFGEKGNLFYISDAQRSDVINIMKEYIKRNEQ